MYDSSCAPSDRNGTRVILAWQVSWVDELHEGMRQVPREPYSRIDGTEWHPVALERVNNLNSPYIQEAIIPSLQQALLSNGGHPTKSTQHRITGR